MFFEPTDGLTRRHRKSLLIFSTISIIISQTNIVPTKFEALGIEIREVDHPALVQISQGIIFYFLLMFLIDGAIEYISRTNHPTRSISYSFFIFPAKLFLDLILPVILSLIAIESLINRCIKIDPVSSKHSSCSFLPFDWINPILNLVRPFADFLFN